MAKRWQLTSWPRGKMVDHLAVLAETRRDHGGGRAQLRHSDGVPIVVYQRPRVWVDRDAWEMLPPNGVLLMRVRPTHEPAFDLVFTPEELENVFGEVRETGSWDKLRYYHFPKNPRAIDSFRVTGGAGLSAGRPLQATASTVRRSTAPTTPTTRPGVTPRPASAPQPTTSAPRTPAPAGSRLEWAHGWFDRLGVPGESDAYLTGVEAWRAAWRPERVKVLLLAESHVAEAPGDARVRVRAPVSVQVERTLPTTYVRLVYCLGYGDNRICSPPPRTTNTGTGDFWELFERIASTGPRHAGEPLPALELARKVAVLERLADRGVWLEDASPLGIYQTGGGRLTRDKHTLDAIERQGYNNYVWPGVADDAPEQVWVVGRTVGRALQGLPGIRPDRVIMQPSYVRRAGVWAEYANEVEGLCQALAGAAP